LLQPPLLQSFHVTAHDHIPHLNISSRSDVTPVSLPQWLRIPFIKVVDATHFEYKPKANVGGLDVSESDKKLRAGDRLYDDSGIAPENTGTVEAFTWSGNDLYALTAGHALEEVAGETFAVQHRLFGAIIRVKHLLTRHPYIDAKEAAMLRVEENDRIKADARLPRTNLSKYSPQGPSKSFQLAADGLLSRGGTRVRRSFSEECTKKVTPLATPSESPPPSSPPEELKLDRLGITVEQLFADEFCQWAVVVAWLAVQRRGRQRCADLLGG
jgi:hypothetical protein